MSTTTINSTSDAAVVSAADRVQTELDLLTTKLRRYVWVSGLLAVMATVVGMLLLTVYFDVILQPESTVLRFLLWASLLAVSAFAAYRFVWQPLRGRCDKLALAWTIEEQRPELHEALTSTLLLAENKQSAEQPFVDAVAAQANQNLEQCRDDDATRRDIRVPGVAAMSCLVVTVFCFAVWPQYLLPSLSNVIAPWKTRQLPYLTASISPGHIAIAEGEALEVSALGRDLNGSVLEIVDGSEVLSSTPMTLATTGNEAKVVLPDLSTDQMYRVRSGSLVSDDYRITVHPRPVVERAKVTLQFPEYTGFEAATIDDLSAPIAAIPGTQCELSVATQTPVAEARLTLGDAPQAPQETSQVDDVWWHHWKLRVDEQSAQPVRLELISEHGVSSEPFSFEIQSVPDKPPTISIKTPTLQQLAVQPDGQLAIQFETADDFGLRSVEVLTQTADAEPERGLVSQDIAATEHAAELIFDPQQHDLEVGDQVTLWLTTSDSRTDEYGGAQAAKSRQLVITVSDDAASIGGQQVIDEEARILETLSDATEHLRQAEETAQQIAETAKQAANAEDVPAETKADAQKLQQQLRDAHQALEQFTDANEDNTGLFEPEKQQIRDIADEDLEEARQQARMIPLTSDSEQQQQTADAASSAIERAEKRLAALKEAIADRADKLQQAAELDELARQQNELARHLEEEEAVLQEAEPKQEEIADRLQDVVENDLDAKSEQFLQRADAAEQLADRTDQLQKQQQQLTDTADTKSDEETREQLTEMIRKEQEALAAEHQQLMEEARQQAADPANQTDPKSEEAAADAQQRMKQAEENLADKNLQAAEENAEQARKKLQEAADAGQEQQPQAKPQKRERLAKRQERIQDAIRAVKKDDFEKATDELQKLITDRVEQVSKEAEELLERPTDDEDNQAARDEAKQNLKEALKDAQKAADKPHDQDDAQPQEQNKAQQQQAGKQDQQKGERQAQQPNEQKKDPPGKQNEAGEKNAQPPQQKKAEQQAPQQQAGKQDQKKDDPQAQQPNEQKKDPPGKQNEAGEKNAQPPQQKKAEQQAQQQQAGKQDQKGDPQAQQPGEQKKGQPAKQNEAGEKNAEPQQQKKAEQQAPQQQAGKQDPKKGDPQAQQPDKQNEAGQKNAQPQRQKKADQQAQQQAGRQDPKKGDPQAQQTNEQKKDQPAEQNEAGEKNPHPQQQKKAEQQAPQQQAGKQNQKKRDPQAQQQEQQKQKQDKAAQSLKKASESLNQFCKSCRKCANCNKGGKSGQSSSGSSKPGGSQQSDKQAGGKKPGDKQAGNKQGGGKRAGQSGEKKSDISKQLAMTADNAQNAARKPTPEAAKKLAKELDELADDAAKKSGYSKRKGNKGEQGSEKQGSQQQKAGAQKQQGETKGSKSPSGEPQGVGNDSQPEDADAIATQLRGPSTSGWTRSHKRLRGSVLDSKRTQIPEAYRGVVEDYFEQLSKIEGEETQPEESR